MFANECKVVSHSIIIWYSQRNVLMAVCCLFHMTVSVFQNQWYIIWRKIEISDFINQEIISWSILILPFVSSQYESNLSTATAVLRDPPFRFATGYVWIFWVCIAVFKERNDWTISRSNAVICLRYWWSAMRLWRNCETAGSISIVSGFSALSIQWQKL